MIKFINKKNNKKMSVNEEYTPDGYINEPSTTMKTNENPIKKYRKKKEHVTFKKDFLCVVEVDSWKQYNIDVSESNYWKKIKPIISENVISINTNTKETNMFYKCFIF